MMDLRFMIWDFRFGIFFMRNLGYGIWNEGCDTWNVEYGMRKVILGM